MFQNFEWVTVSRHWETPTLHHSAHPCLQPAKEHVIFSLSDHLKEHVSGKLLTARWELLGDYFCHHKEGMPGHRGPLLSGGRPGPAEWVRHHPSGWLRKSTYGRWDFWDLGVLHHGCNPPGRTNKVLPQLKHWVGVGQGEWRDRWRHGLRSAELLKEK